MGGLLVELAFERGSIEGRVTHGIMMLLKSLLKSHVHAHHGHWMLHVGVLYGRIPQIALGHLEVLLLLEVHASPLLLLQQGVDHLCGKFLLPHLLHFLQNVLRNTYLTS